MEHIYFAKKFRTTEAESKSRMTEHERKGRGSTPSYVWGNFITGSNTSRDFSSSGDVQTRLQKERKRKERRRNDHDHVEEVTKYKRRGSCAAMLTFISY